MALWQHEEIKVIYSKQQFWREKRCSFHVLRVLPHKEYTFHIKGRKKKENKTLLQPHCYGQMTFKSMLCDELQWINNLKNKTSSRDNMDHCSIKQKGWVKKKSRKKSQNPVCFSCQNHILKWLQLFFPLWKLKLTLPDTDTVMKSDEKWCIWHFKIIHFYKICSLQH